MAYTSLVKKAANQKAGSIPPPRGLAGLARWEVIVDPVLQFSKDRHLMDRTPERLKKELEEELLLSSEDLRSHAWYHGRIPRQVPALLMQHARIFSGSTQISDPQGHTPRPRRSKPQFSQKQIL